MTRTSALLLALLAVLGAVWAFSSTALPAGGAPAANVPMPAGDASRRPSVFDLRVATERLRARAANTEPRDTKRNPFRFDDQGNGPATRDPQAAQPVVETSAAPAVVAPTVSLIGIVERTVDGKPVRVAVVSMADALYYVTVGERVGARYEVVAVGADAVELKDLAEGPSRRVALR